MLQITQRAGVGQVLELSSVGHWGPWSLDVPLMGTFEVKTWVAGSDLHPHLQLK